MKTRRLLATALVASLVAVTAFAGDPTGTWKWSVATPNGDLETTLKLTLKDGQIAGTYSNTFGDASISNASFKDDAIAFDVQREFDGNKFVLKYQGKLAGDTIKGTIEVPGMDGGEPRKMDWNARRTDKTPPPAAT
jgi:hypothetical protein